LIKKSNAHGAGVRTLKEMVYIPIKSNGGCVNPASVLLVSEINNANGSGSKYGLNAG
jgi:hypothetical protein